MNECPFCECTEETADRNDLCYLLKYEDVSALQGYMVIPFRHVESPFALTPAEWSAMQPLVIRAQELLEASVPDGFNLGWNVGRAGGQEVPHVHLHVFSRFADEPFAGRGIRSWLKSDDNRRLAP